MVCLHTTRNMNIVVEIYMTRYSRLVILKYAYVNFDEKKYTRTAERTFLHEKVHSNSHTCRSEVFGKIYIYYGLKKCSPSLLDMYVNYAY